MSSIVTPLAILSQVEQTPSNEEGIPSNLEDDLRILGCQLIQQTGILLKQYDLFLFVYVSSPNLKCLLQKPSGHVNRTSTVSAVLVCKLDEELWNTSELV
jgi:hypothetical protein